MLLGAPVVLGVEEQVAVAAGLLGAVHRVVGVAQQRVGIGLVDRVHGGADARGDGDRAGADAEAVGHGDVAHDALDRVAAFLQRGGAQQQHELIAAEPRHRIVAAGPVAQRAAQALGQVDQQAVAGFVSEAVVDRLEVVEVEVADRQQEAFALAGAHGVAQQLREAGAVGQAGQLVGVGLALELRALRLRLRDVGQRPGIEADLPAARLHRRDGDLQTCTRRRCGGGRRSRRASCRSSRRLSRIEPCWRSAAEPVGAGRISAGTVPSISSRA